MRHGLAEEGGQEGGQQGLQTSATTPQLICIRLLKHRGMQALHTAPTSIPTPAGIPSAHAPNPPSHPPAPARPAGGRRAGRPDPPPALPPAPWAGAPAPPHSTTQHSMVDPCALLGRACLGLQQWGRMCIGREGLLAWLRCSLVLPHQHAAAATRRPQGRSQRPSSSRRQVQVGRGGEARARPEEGGSTAGEAHRPRERLELGGRLLCRSCLGPGARLLHQPALVVKREALAAGAAA